MFRAITATSSTEEQLYNFFCVVYCPCSVYLQYISAMYLMATHKNPTATNKNAAQKLFI